jgi:hypothetical protein
MGLECSWLLGMLKYKIDDLKIESILLVINENMKTEQRKMIK